MNLQLEVDILRIILKEERSSHAELQARELCLIRDFERTKEDNLLIAAQCEDVREELKEAKSVIEALESQQILSINEMEDLRSSNSHHAEILSKKELEISALKDKMFYRELRDSQSFKCSESQDSSLQVKLKKMHESLEKAKRLNTRYQSDREFQESNEEDMDEVRRQVEAETAEVIVCLQDELSLLQQQVEKSNSKEMETQERLLSLEAEMKELEGKMHLKEQDNKISKEMAEEKDKELTIMSKEWELLTSEIELLLSDGNEALKVASDELDSVSSSFPWKRNQISEQVGRIRKVLSEKECLIENLNQCLEDASNKRSEMEVMLRSLRGAALVITEAHEQECRDKEKEIRILKESCSELQLQLSQEQKRACAVEQKLEEIRESDILKTSEKLAELKNGVSALQYCVNDYAEKVANNNEDGATTSPVSLLSDGECEERTGSETRQEIHNVDSYAVEDLKMEIPENPHEYSSIQKNLASGRIGKDESDRDATNFFPNLSYNPHFACFTWEYK